MRKTTLFAATLGCFLAVGAGAMPEANSQFPPTAGQNMADEFEKLSQDAAKKRADQEAQVRKAAWDRSHMSMFQETIRRAAPNETITGSPVFGSQEKGTQDRCGDPEAKKDGFLPFSCLNVPLYTNTWFIRTDKSLCKVELGSRYPEIESLPGTSKHGGAQIKPQCTPLRP